MGEIEWEGGSAGYQTMGRRRGRERKEAMIEMEICVFGLCRIVDDGGAVSLFG